MDELFSERYGYVVKQLQFESLNSVTRSFLWEQLYFVFILQIEEVLEGGDPSVPYSNARSLLMRINRDIFRRTLLEMPNDINEIINSCQYAFINSAWYRAFDFIEYFVKNSSDIFSSRESYENEIEVFTEKINEILVAEKVMYRLTSSLIVPITNEAELSTISTSLEVPQSLKAVETHIIKSLKLLSDRVNPDYYNSIKESISALESLLKIIVKQPNATIKTAVDEIKKRQVMTLDKNFENTLISLYAWSGNEGGIRHADKGSGSVIDLDDAKFTIVTCCSLVNYLMAKATKAGIKLM